LDLDHRERWAPVIPVIERVVGARVNDPRLREELVQETMARLLDQGDRLEEAALVPYAVVTARNLVWSHLRTVERQARNVHRLVDRRDPAAPEEDLLAREERQAVSAAVARLSLRDRNLLLAHEVEGMSTADMADEHQSSPGAISVRLASARAKLRVEYLLAYRRVDLPTTGCRPVLVSLSAADQRRQRALGAGEHLPQRGIHGRELGPADGEVGHHAHERGAQRPRHPGCAPASRRRRTRGQGAQVRGQALVQAVCISGRWRVGHAL